MRLLCCLFVLFLLNPVVRAQSSADHKLNFTNTGAPLSVVLSALSKEAGIKFEATGAMGNQIVAMRLKDATLAETMEKIVWATGGEWEKIDGGYRLILSSSALKALTLRDHEAQIAEIKQFLAQLPEDKGPLKAEEAKSIATELNGMLKQKGGLGALSDEKAVRHMIDLSVRIPEVRVAIICAHAISPDEIAGIPLDTSVTYSSRPNRSQRMMPAKGLADIASIRNDWVEWVKACNTIANEEERRQLLDQGGTHDANALMQGASRVLLRVHRSETGVEFDLRELDASSKEILRLPMSTEDLDFLDLDRRKGRTVPLSKDKLESSADAKEFSRIFGFDEDSDAPDSGSDLIPRKWLSKFAEDSSFEPLWLVGEELVNLASLEDRNLVANLTDKSLEETANWVVNSSMNPEKLLDILRGEGQQEVMRSDGWMELRPTYPIHNDANRCSRVALGHLVKAFLSKGRMGLADMIRYATESKAEPVFSSFDYTLMSDLLDECGNQGLYSVMTTEGTHVLRLIGCLTPEAIGRLESGEPLVLSTADEPTRSLVIETLRGELTPIRVNSGAPDRSGEEEPERTRSDSTELFPDGLPARVALKLEKSSEDVAVGHRAGDATPLVGFSARELASYLGDAGAASIDSGGKDSRSNLYSMGVRTSWSLSVFLAPDLKVEYDIADMEFDPKSARVPYASLPKAYRDATEKVRSEISNIPPAP